MTILIKILQFLLSLSILVIIHELGHFVFAKLFKTRVEKFYLFFDPWFSLFKRKKGETEYGIGWVPLGGYVKISGMIDESMDKEQMKQPPQPCEFRSKTSGQRLLIMTGGVLFNFILALLIYVCVLYAWGETYLPTANVKYGIVTDSVGYSIGLRNGDKILSVDNQKIENFAQITSDTFILFCHYSLISGVWLVSPHSRQRAESQSWCSCPPFHACPSTCMARHAGVPAHRHAPTRRRPLSHGCGHVPYRE